MKRTTICIAAALVAALATGAMAGCSSQPASSASASASASAASSEAAAQSTDELASELKGAIANAPAFKSVTVSEETVSAFEVEPADASASAASEASEASASAASVTEPETITGTSVYKFDASGDKLKTSADNEVAGSKFQCFTDGDDAVFVTDGPAYSGTVEQFDWSYSKGFEQYLAGAIGDLSVLTDCAASIEKTESDGLAFYMLTLDPEKYIASDEVLKLMADNGDPVKDSILAIGFDANGNIISIDHGVNYEKGHSMAKHLVISDYDSTVIDPMPAADKTYEEMEADMKEKLDAFENELEQDAASEEAASSSAAAEAQ